MDGQRYLIWFLARRLLALVVVLAVLSLVIFSLLYLAPGSAIDVLLGSRPRSPAVVKALTLEYHLNRPFLSQYRHWLAGALHFDFGESIASQVPVTTVIGRGLAVTLPLAGMAFVLTMVVGVTLGIASALRAQSALDRTIGGLTIMGASAPVFALGVFLLYVFGVTLGWFPVFGTGSGLGGRVDHLVLPTVALTISASAFVVKLTRSAVITALQQDYIVFARARGLSRTRVIFAYALRNALIPIVTTGGILLGMLLTGAVVIEATFDLPGIGNLLVQSVTDKDIPVVQALALLIAAMIVVVNLATDVLYPLIDPRIRYADANQGGR